MIHKQSWTHGGESNMSMSSASRETKLASLRSEEAPCPGLWLTSPRLTLPEGQPIYTPTPGPQSCQRHFATKLRWPLSFAFSTNWRLSSFYVRLCNLTLSMSVIASSVRHAVNRKCDVFIFIGSSIKLPKKQSRIVMKEWETWENKQ